MKFAVLLCFCLGLCRGFDELCQGDNLKRIYTKCLTLNGFEKVVTNRFLQFPGSKNENDKCFRACILHECQFISAHGQFSHDVPARLAALLHSGLESQIRAIEKTTANCIGQLNYGETVCNIAEEFTKCMVRQTTVRLRTNDIIGV